jgi:putative ABC transport system permease protein
MMRKSLHKLRFAIRIAFKNLTYHPLKTILMMIGFLGVFMVLLLSFSMKDFFRSYHQARLIEKYQTYELSVSVSQTGNTRFFSISKLNMDTELVSMIEDQTMFFEFDVLLETSVEQTYVHVYASHIEEFNKISNHNQNVQSLEDDEMIVTSSFSMDHQLSINDKVIIYIKESQKTFTIVEIVEDGKLFSGDSVFIEKDEALPFFLTSLSPSLESLPSSLLKNMYNTIYIDIKEESSFEDVVLKLKSITGYENLDYDKTIDEDAIEQFVERNFSAFLMILTIVLIAVLFVLETTLLVYFNEKKSLFSTIHILGGRKKFSFSIVGIELFFLFIFSFILSIYLTKGVIVYGLKYLESTAIYDLSIEDVIISFLIGIVAFILVIVFYFVKYYQVSDIAQLKEITKKQKHTLLFKCVLLISLFIGYQALNSSQFISLEIEYKALLFMIMIIIVTFFTPYILIDIIDTSLAKKKEKSILFYQFRMLVQQSSFKHYTHMILISFLTILLLVFANLYMSNRSKSYQDAYKVDFILSQITRNYDQTYSDLLNVDEVKEASKAAMFNDVSIDLDQQNISQLISMNQDEITTYFNLDIDEVSLNDLSQNNQYNIVLPDRYQYIYDLKYGDYISIYVDGNFGYQDFHISGFFEKQLGDLAFANLHLFDASIYNVILVNAKDQKDILRSSLLDQFSDQLIAVIDVDDSISHLIQDMQRITIYITVVLSIIILCFITALMNHTSILFRDMESYYAKLLVLGLSRKAMISSLSHVFIIIFSIFFMISVFSYAFISKHLAFFGILFGEYEPIKFNFAPIIYGGIIILFTYTFIQIIYIKKVLKVDIGQIHRQFIS